MKQLVEKAGLEDRFVIDSAGILSYHEGELPDPRMRAHAARRGYNLTHRSRPYYGGAEGFEYVLDLLEDACTGLLEHLRKQ